MRVTTTPFEEAERLEELRAVSGDFVRRTSGTAKDIAHAYHGAVTSDRGPETSPATAAMDAALDAVRADGSLRLVSGGLAGGVKVADDRDGAFFKISEDQHGIYKGSAVMADKPAKHELAALSHVHDVVDSLHVTAPLVSCVDVTVRSAAASKVYRVQAFSLLPIDSSTLRLGSEDGLGTAHVCAEWLPVARLVADAFHLAPSRLQPRLGAVHAHLHKLTVGERDAARVPDCGQASEAVLSDLGVGRSAGTSSGECKRVEQEFGVALDPLVAVEASCEHRSGKLDELLRGGPSVVDSLSGMIDGSQLRLPLPFDVEGHMLASGERVLADTHRLDLHGMAAAAAAGDCSGAAAGEVAGRALLASEADPDHTELDSAEFRALAASCCEANGDYDGAVRLLSECRSAKASTLGVAHPSYAMTLNDIAVCLHAKGDYDGAFELHRECQGIRASTLGTSHPLYGTTLNNMASCLQARGDSVSAVRLYVECRDIRASTLGTLHPEYASALNNIASCLQATGHYDGAIKLYKECRDIRASTLGTSHPEHASALNNIAVCLNAKGDYDGAIELHRECRSARASCLGVSHPLYAMTLNNMAVCLLAKGDHEGAMELHHECRGIRASTLGTSHPDYAATLNNMASCLHAKGDFDGAIELYMECRDIRASTLGRLHPEYAMTLNNVAVCLKDKGDYEGAIELHSECRLVLKSTLGTAHPDYATTLSNLGDCMLRQGKAGEAMSLSFEALSITRAALGPDHPQTQRLQENYETTMSLL